MITPLQNHVAQTPGYLEAVSQEQLVRDAAFLVTTERIGTGAVSFVVGPLTFRKYLILRLAGSPLLPPVRTPAPGDLAQFLWVLQPDYAPENQAGRERFLRSCQVFVPPRPPVFLTGRSAKKWKARETAALRLAAELIDSAREFVDESLMDRPGGGVENGEPDYFSDAASVIGRLARAYGWPAETILELPLKQLFQHLREIRVMEAAAAGQACQPGNPSDRVIAEFMAAKNRKN